MPCKGANLGGRKVAAPCVAIVGNSCYLRGVDQYKNIEDNEKSKERD